MPWALSSMGLMGGRLETRDAALRAHRPSVAAGDVGPGSASDDPKLAAHQVGNGGTEAFGAGARRSGPGAATVGGKDDILAGFGVLGVIAAHRDTVARVREGEGEDA